MAKAWGDAWRNYTGPVKGGPPSAMQPKVDAGGTMTIGKAPKYHNVKTTTYDGVLCDSKREAARWEQLRALQAAGMIADLLPHPAFPLYVNGSRTGRFTGDALYTENGRLVVEDTKSPITAKTTAYRQRVRTFQACYPHVTFKEFIK
jgi:hypothetical protein